MSQTGSPPAEPAPEAPAPAVTRGDNKDDTNDVTEDPVPMDSPNSRVEEGEASEPDDAPSPSSNEKPPSGGSGGGPPLPAEPVPSAGPPLPREPVPQQEDDGWDCQWEPNAQAWYFVNRFTGKSQWDNPRMAAAAPPSTNTTSTATVTAPLPPSSELPAAGGYNPAIHGDYDPNAWYAQGASTEDVDGVEAESEDAAAAAGLDPYTATARFNRFTGQFQDEGAGPGRHSDDAKSRRQMNAFFDVDAAANSHDGRSLKAERSNKKPSKTEVKAFKEKRRARKEEKRRAWLRD
ncbi:hypothetical protein N3K66_001860 [Trichothecium roseum]|uniref:Uncharacterized protein n=1 Tax=Trichothecium roseum TaxID=47278 RepID=A0ACC0V9Q9_9HYPO|nr:hypothetical protein N3K66_001860 [Trichothecium roseum]